MAKGGHYTETPVDKLRHFLSGGVSHGPKHSPRPDSNSGGRKSGYTNNPKTK